MAARGRFCSWWLPRRRVPTPAGMGRRRLDGSPGEASREPGSPASTLSETLPGRALRASGLPARAGGALPVAPDGARGMALLLDRSTLDPHERPGPARPGCRTVKGSGANGDRSGVSHPQPTEPKRSGPSDPIAWRGKRLAASPRHSRPSSRTLRTVARDLVRRRRPEQEAIPMAQTQGASSRHHHPAAHRRPEDPAQRSAPGRTPRCPRHRHRAAGWLGGRPPPSLLFHRGVRARGHLPAGGRRAR